MLRLCARTALFEACDVLGLTAGDEILVPAYNCGAEIDVFRARGLAVVFVQVASDGNIRAQDVERKLTQNTRAVLLIHYFGIRQKEMDKISKLCHAKNVSVIEDCALSLLNEAGPTNHTPADISVYSFYKFFPVTRGGAIVVRNAGYKSAAAAQSAGIRRGIAAFARATRQTAILTLAPLLRSLILQSISPSPAPVISPFPDMPPSYYFDWSLVGRGMLGLDFLRLSLMDADRAARRRMDNFVCYLGWLEESKEVSLLFRSLPEGAVPLCFPVMVDRPSSLVAFLASKGISSNAWWAGYNRNFDYRSFPVSCDLKDRVVALPCHQLIDEDDVRTIAQCVNEWASSLA